MENIMGRLAVLSMKEMNKKDRSRCLRAVIKSIDKLGYVPEELSREIIDLGMKKDRERIEANSNITSFFTITIQEVE